MMASGTNEPQRIAVFLINQLDGGAAALLVAILKDAFVAVQPDDVGYISELETEGCVAEGKVTPLGAKVAAILQSKHGVVVPSRKS